MGAKSTEKKKMFRIVDRKETRHRRVIDAERRLLRGVSCLVEGFPVERPAHAYGGKKRGSFGKDRLRNLSRLKHIYGRGGYLRNLIRNHQIPRRGSNIQLVQPEPTCRRRRESRKGPRRQGAVRLGKNSVRKPSSESGFERACRRRGRLKANAGMGHGWGVWGGGASYGLLPLQVITQSFENHHLQAEVLSLLGKIFPGSQA